MNVEWSTLIGLGIVAWLAVVVLCCLFVSINRQR